MFASLNVWALVLVDAPKSADGPAELGIATVSASSVGNRGGKKAVNAIDGDVGTVWQPNPRKKGPQWLQIDLGDRLRIDRCTIRMAPPAADAPEASSEERASLVRPQIGARR